MDNWGMHKNSSLTLSLLMYTHGAPSKARNLTSCIYGRDFFYWGSCFLNRAFR
jgi:hypothetical protein